MERRDLPQMEEQALPPIKEKGLGARFYAGLAGVVLACGVVALIMILLFSRAVIAWGVFGAFIVLAAALLLFAWIFDRRAAREI
jgi:cobalamin synthase